MEQMNRIELKGNVGNVRISEVGESRVAKFSLATNYTYTDKNGNSVVETMWHNVVAWEGKNTPDIDKIAKGSHLHVCGRLKCSRYTGNDGTEKQIYEVIANKISFLGETAS